MQKLEWKCFAAPSAVTQCTMMARRKHWIDRQIESHFDGKVETPLAFLCFFWGVLACDKNPLSSSKIVRSKAGPSPRDRLLPLSRFDDVGRYLLSSGRLALAARFPFLRSRFRWLVSLVNLHLLLARPSGLNIPSEAHVSAAVADVPRPIQEQVDAVGIRVGSPIGDLNWQPRWQRPLVPTGKSE